jgi:hypothetical protein
VQNWEYLEVEIKELGSYHPHPWQDSMGRSGELKRLGEELSNSAPLLNELGAQGWELVGVYSPGRAAKLILKRPRT